MTYRHRARTNLTPQVTQIERSATIIGNKHRQEQKPMLRWHPPETHWKLPENKEHKLCVCKKESKSQVRFDQCEACHDVCGVFVRGEIMQQIDNGAHME
ncbi:hypothetical protein QVD17_05677 [Tagetes erecta]|uniref:Uncharacterized protein n=1 Tax=Tagetes erecta TaxID=13708 RepID=A0AAD8LM03_TARER|nr:hypothetical protein QVD17_05677 [Tagetes erecta]